MSTESHWQHTPTGNLSGPISVIEAIFLSKIARLFS